MKITLEHFDLPKETSMIKNLDYGMDRIPEISVIQDAIDCIAECTDIHLSENEFLRLVEGYDPEILNDLEQWGIDTLTRDTLLDLIAYKFISKDWPRYKDTCDIDSFMKELHAAAKLRGYVVKSA